MLFIVPHGKCIGVNEYACFLCYSFYIRTRLPAAVAAAAAATGGGDGGIKANEKASHIHGHARRRRQTRRDPNKKKSNSYIAFIKRKTLI